MTQIVVDTTEQLIEEVECDPAVIAAQRKLAASKKRRNNCFVKPRGRRSAILLRSYEVLGGKSAVVQLLAKVGATVHSAIDNENVAEYLLQQMRQEEIRQRKLAEDAREAKTSSEQEPTVRPAARRSRPYRKFVFSCTEAALGDDDSAVSEDNNRYDCPISAAEAVFLEQSRIVVKIPIYGAP